MNARAARASPYRLYIGAYGHISGWPLLKGKGPRIGFSAGIAGPGA